MGLLRRCFATTNGEVLDPVMPIDFDGEACLLLGVFGVDEDLNTEDTRFCLVGVIDMKD